MNRPTLDQACERGILGLVLAILIFGPLAMGAVERRFFLVIQGLTLAVMLLWCLRLWLSPRPVLFWPPVCWAVLAFALYAVVRYLTADLEHVARLEMIRVLIYAFLFLAIVNNLYRQEHAQIIAMTLVFLAMGIAAYAIFQFVTGSDKVWNVVKPYAHRGTGTYISPNHLGGFLEMILPLGLAWTLMSRAKIVTKIVLGYASLVVLVGIAVTLSRGSWVATALALAFFFGVLIQHRTYRIPALALLLLLAGAGVYFVPRTHFFQARIKEITADDQFHDSARLEVWRPAVQLWQENIWWGVGPNHYNYRFRAYRPQTEQRQPDRVHNDYLNTLTDWGIAGATLVAAAWALWGIGVFQTWRVVRGKSSDLGGRNSNKFAFLLGASLGLLAILIHSVVDFNLHIPANAILAVSLMALSSVSLRFVSDRYWLTARASAKILVTILLLAGMTYLGWQGVRRTREGVWLKQARQSTTYPEAQAALEKAFQIEPKNFETAYALAETFRLQSWEGGGDYAALATNAMGWFQRTTTLNRYEGYGFMRYGMCLDWLGQTGASTPYFDQAIKLDPNGYFTAANVGWHYFQTGDYAAAKVWFERSRRLEPKHNPIADNYLPLVDRLMLEAATNAWPSLVPSPVQR